MFLTRRSGQRDFDHSASESPRSGIPATAFAGYGMFLVVIAVATVWVLLGG